MTKKYIYTNIDALIYNIDKIMIDVSTTYKFYANTHAASRQNCPVVLLRLKSQNWKSGTSK